MYSYFWTWNPSTTIPWTVFAAIRFDFILVSNSNHIYQVIKRPVRLPCQHYFCRDCVNFSKCHVCGRTISLTELCEDKVLNYVVESSREATESCANCDQVCLDLQKYNFKIMSDFPTNVLLWNMSTTAVQWMPGNNTQSKDLQSSPHCTAWGTRASSKQAVLLDSQRTVHSVLPWFKG